MRRVWWLWESFQQIVLKTVLGDPRIAGGCTIDMNNRFSLPWIRPTWEESIKQRDQVLVHDPRRIEGSSQWQHRHNIELAEIPLSGPHAFSGRNGRVCHYKCIFMTCCPDPIANIFMREPALVPGDQTTPIIVRLCTWFGTQLSAYGQTSLCQFTRQGVGNAT
jgi:hypothetical protein